jgi:SAM-dependent methyltransferase
MSRWNSSRDVVRGADYDDRWRDLAASGQSVHGEADLVSSCAPASVLDAGCGTGRVAIELAVRGIDVVGVDLDERMLSTAREKAPDLEWIAADLSSVMVGDEAGGRRAFDTVVLAGNVMIFLEPGTEGAVVANLARHLGPGGLFIAGFQLGAGRLGLDDYDRLAESAKLELESRWATWDKQPFIDGDYAVSVHRLRAG